MQYVEGTVTASRGWFHPVDRIIYASPDVHAERVLQMLLLDDGTITTLQEFSGDRDLVEYSAGEIPEVLEYQVAPQEDPVLVYAHIEPTELLSSLIEMPHQYRVIPDFPVEYLGDGTIRLRVVGDESEIKDALYSLPDGLEAEIEKIGPYAPEEDRILDILTERQYEIAMLAIEMGYYDTPREAKYEDIAEEADVTPGTVGAILRKVESQLLHELLT